MSEGATPNASRRFWPTRWAGWLVLGAGAFTLAYIVWIAAGGPNTKHGYAVSQVLYLAVGAVAVFLAAQAARAHRGQKRNQAAWALVAASLAAFWLGEVLWTIAESSSGNVESPNWADLCYLIYYPLLLTALILLSVRSGSRAERFKIALDAATIFLGGGVLVWYFVLRPSLEGLGSTFADAITIAYPTGDLLLILGIAVLAVGGNRFRSIPALVTLLSAVVFGFAADLAYGYTSMLDSYEAAGIIDVVYLVSWFLFCLAAAFEYQAASSEQRVPAPAAAKPAGEEARRPHVLPYFAIGIALVVLVWALRPTFGTAEAGAAVAAVLVTVLAMARQIVAMREASRLREVQAIQASEERFQNLLRRTQFSVDHVAEAMMWTAPDGRIVDVNTAACKMLGYSNDELLRMTIFQIATELGEDQARWQQSWEATKKQGSRVIEAEHRTKSGRMLPVEVSINYLDYSGEEFNVAFAHDISERRRAEQTLRETEAQLRQSQKMDAIGQLAGGIAHDFNNLLTAIVGYCELILASGEGVSEPVRADVEEIKAAADRATALTRRILLFSRRQPLESKVVGLNDVVADVERLLNRTLGEHVELATILHPDAGRVEVDVVQFEQAITNLAVNARDAMPHGGRLTIETGLMEIDEEFCALRPGMLPGMHAVLAVSDTGEGMDEETKTRAFEPFFTTKEAGKGTGLGMTSVYGTVKQSGGGVFIYSERGYGTTVKVYLPQLVDARNAPGSGMSPLPAAAAYTAVAPRHSETVLVVEDEQGIRHLVKRVLAARGYQVLQAANADDAVPILEDDAQQIDMLLTDVILPGSLQGGDLAKRALALRPSLTILYMSGYTRDTVLQAGRLQAGMHYLEKPFTPQALSRRVREVLDQGPELGAG